jgi:hypothetical protein
MIFMRMGGMQAIYRQVKEFDALASRTTGASGKLKRDEQ